jgi:AraC family transcriptional regulator
MELMLPGGRFGGEVVRSCKLRGLKLTETAYSAGLRLPKHSHEHACFIFVLRGSFGENYEKRFRLCKPRTLIYRPAHEVHSNHFYSAGGRCLNIEVEPEWASLVRHYSVSLDSSADFHGGPMGWLAAKLYREFERPDEISPLAIEGLLLEIAAGAARLNTASAPKAPAWLGRAQDFLHAHYSEGFSVSDIAEAVGAHPSHLARLFRRHYGCTVGEYVRRLRVEFACRELSKAGLTLAEIATAAGFYDQAHFSRTFKRLTGMTPAAYRELASGR